MNANLGNISKKGLQVLTCDFSSEMKKKIIRFIENSISKYSEFTDIVLNIGNQWKDSFGGKWTVSIGEINKINSYTNADNLFAVTIGPYKIIVTYCA